MNGPGSPIADSGPLERPVAALIELLVAGLPYRGLLATGAAGRRSSCLLPQRNPAPLPAETYGGATAPSPVVPGSTTTTWCAWMMDRTEGEQAARIKMINGGRRGRTGADARLPMLGGWF